MTTHVYWTGQPGAKHAHRVHWRGAGDYARVEQDGYTVYWPAFAAMTCERVRLETPEVVA